MTSSNNLSPLLTAILQAADVLRRFDVDAHLNAASVGYCKVRILHKQEVEAGDIDLSVNEQTIALLLAAKDLIAASETATKGKPNVETEKVEKADEAKSQSNHGSEASGAGNFSQAVSPDKASEGTAAEA